MKTHLLKLTPAKFCDATDACEEGRKFAVKYKTMAAVWSNCPRVDWLCWILNQLDVPPDEKAVRLYMVWCARNTPLADGRTTLALLTDKRSTDALDVAERFAHGNATQKELAAAWDAAGDAARDAARAAAWTAAGDAARDAAWAAAWDAARAAAWDAAWDAAWTAAGDAARDAARDAQTAEFRRVVSNPFTS